MQHMMRLIALFLCIAPCSAPPRKAQSLAGNSDEDIQEDGRSQGDSHNSVWLAGLVILLSGTAKVCKLCGSSSDLQNLYGEADADCKWWPWQYYWPLYDSEGVHVTGRRASGKICAICVSVMKQSTLMKVHGSIAKYVKWKNSGDALERHAPFMQDFRVYLAKIKQQPEGMRVHIRHRLK